MLGFVSPERKQCGGNPRLGQLRIRELSIAVASADQMGPARGRGQGHSKAIVATDIHAVFADVYGDRWSLLHRSLSQPTQHVALQNTFASGAHFDNKDWHPSTQLGPIKTHCCNEAHESYEQPTSDAQSRLLSWYWLDEASLLPALMLDPKPGHTVLDMCAAPGGKSLTLASMLFGQQRSTPTASLAAEPSGQPSAQSLTADLDRQGPAANANHTQHSAVSASELKLPDGVAESSLPALHEASNGTDNTQQAAIAAAPLAEQPTPDLADMRVSTPAASNSDLNLTATLSAQHGQHTAAIGSLTCNELDPSRKSRLQIVMDSYLPPALKKRVRLTPHDSARYWSRFEPDTYDCVLLDAPCTSERHVLQQAVSGSGKSAKLRWSVRQCEDMAALQVRLLTAALKTVRCGGRVVYSTCSISPLENDQVVSKAIALLQDQMHISIGSYPQQMLREPIKLPSEPIELPLEPIKLPSEPFRASASLAELLHQVGAEPTKHGIIVLPDKAGSGPMYVCLLLKS
ncbi:TPA: 5-methylcytosine rRNA methyltransferase nsun4 [Trebouxia sp. C0006]